jgi:hypothetical protein
VLDRAAPIVSKIAKLKSKALEVISGMFNAHRRDVFGWETIGCVGNDKACLSAALYGNRGNIRNVRRSGSRKKRAEVGAGVARDIR